MDKQAAKPTIIRRLLISAAAIGVAAAIPAPAFASGGHGHHRGHHGGYYYQPHHYSYGYSHYPRYSHYRYYDYDHHRRGHISAGEGALIAAGIIGGVILIDRALDNRDRYDDRRYDSRYDDRDRGAFDDDDYYYQRDNRPYDNRNADRYDGDYRSADAVDDRLLGDGDRARPAVLADAAFRECVAETRGAAGAGGMSVAMPGAPTEVEELADGSVRMTAQFRASNPRGESWTRRFVCEADDQGVRFLQVD
jgi:hypothetical protein